MPSASNPTRINDEQASPGERTYGTFQHLTLLAAPAAFLSIVAAIIMWQLRKDESPFLEDHGRESVNFQISLLLYGALAAGLRVVGVGFVLFPLVVVLAVVGMIMAARAANRGEYFRYPMCLRVLE